jgi:hypothetical protein
MSLICPLDTLDILLLRIRIEWGKKYTHGTGKRALCSIFFN